MTFVVDFVVAGRGDRARSARVHSVRSGRAELRGDRAAAPSAERAARRPPALRARVDRSPRLEAPEEAQLPDENPLECEFCICTHSRIELQAKQLTMAV